MANKGSTGIQQNPVWSLRSLHVLYTIFKARNGSYARAATATLGSATRSKTRVDVRSNSYWKELALPLVVSKLRSSDHSIVLQAVKELRARGNLGDGALSWACLRYANLQDANLSGSNFRNADLEKAHMERADLSHSNLNHARLIRTSLQSANLEKASMEGANLVGAKLQGAINVSIEQLAQACRLRGAVLPDSNLYDGRFNLPGDFADACMLHIDLNDPAAIASFYGVSCEDFIHGQEWRLTNMPSVSAWQDSACYQNAELIIKWL